MASLATLIDARTPIVLWGTGTLTLHLLRNGRFRQLNVTAFVDRNSQFQGKTIDGLPVLAPEALKKLDEMVLVVSRSYEREIAASIREHFKLENSVWKLFDRANATT